MWGIFKITEKWGYSHREFIESWVYGTMCHKNKKRKESWSEKKERIEIEVINEIFGTNLKYKKGSESKEDEKKD